MELSDILSYDETEDLLMDFIGMKADRLELAKSLSLQKWEGIVKYLEEKEEDADIWELFDEKINKICGLCIFYNHDCSECPVDDCCETQDWEDMREAEDDNDPDAMLDAARGFREWLINELSAGDS